MSHRSPQESVRFQNTGSTTELNTQLSEDQWFLIQDLFPDRKVSTKGGRPAHSSRDCFEGILYVLITGIRWNDLPKCFPSKSVCHARFKKWSEDGLFQLAWERLLRLKQDLRQLDLSTIIGDGTFVPAKKGDAA